MKMRERNNFKSRFGSVTLAQDYRTPRCLIKKGTIGHYNTGQWVFSDGRFTRLFSEAEIKTCDTGLFTTEPRKKRVKLEFEFEYDESIAGYLKSTNNIRTPIEFISRVRSRIENDYYAAYGTRVKSEVREVDE